MQETGVQPLGWEDPPEQEMATHSSIPAWRIPRTEEPGGLQSIDSQRVIHYRNDLAHMHAPSPRDWTKVSHIAGTLPSDSPGKPLSTL